MSTDSHGNNTSAYSDDQESDANGYYARPANSPPSEEEEYEEEGEKTKPISALRAKRVRPPDETDEGSPPARKKAAVPSGAAEGAGGGGKSQANFDEIMATAYAKGFSILNQKHSAAAVKSKKAEKAPGESKKPPGWTPHDEMILAKVLIACASGGQVQMAPFYERAHEALPETSNSQVYDKMRRMRSRFWQIQNQLRESGISDDRFPFRSPHEAKLYAIWKQIWGDESERCRNGAGSASGNHRPEDDAPRRASEKHEFVSDEDGDPHVYGNNNSNSAGGNAFGRGLVAQVKGCVQNTMEEYVSRVETLVSRGVSPSSSSSGTLGFGIDVAAISKRLKEFADSARSSSLPGLEGAEGRSIRQKWRRVHSDELRVFASRLELILEEARFHIKRLETSPIP